MGEGRGVHRVLVGKPEGKRPLGRPRRRWEDNINMDLREVGGVETGWSWLRIGTDVGLQPGHYSSLTAPNLQPTANQERYDQCGNQHHSRELLMMGIVMPEIF